MATTVEFGDRFQHGDYFAQILTDDHGNSMGIENGANALERFIDWNAELVGERHAGRS